MAVGEEQETESGQGGKRFDVATVNGCPLKSLDELLHPEEEGNQSQRFVIRTLVTGRQMM